MRQKKKKTIEYEWKLEILIHGETKLKCNPFKKLNFGSDQKQQKELWLKHKAEIMRKWDKPGKRPYAWWLFEATGFRKRLSKIGFTDEEISECNSGSIFGIPNEYFCNSTVFSCEFFLFESQASFLKRHGCLSKKEENLSTFEPEKIINEFIDEYSEELDGN